jgi:tRNA pseudouridine32 synthase/23S rRNA pseudouridine746 synthase
VALPHQNPPYPSLLDFLDTRFSGVGRENWRRRILSGSVWYDDGSAITTETAFRPQAKLLYFREVDHEEPIPFQETILYQDKHILVADKPHFLPVIPAGKYVNESLLYRLKRATGIDALSPIHRIDRDTAGVVIFSVDKTTRGLFQSLFLRRTVKKTYQAIADCQGPVSGRKWSIANRIIRGEPWFRMKIAADGPVNARTTVHLVARNNNALLLRLEPATGKKHQLRLHICSLGWQIRNDRYYPHLYPDGPPDFNAPLQLLAKSISFIHPVTEKPVLFESEQSMAWNSF